MATIDALDIQIYIQYAKRASMVEQINHQYHLNEAATIPAQIRILDLYPKPSEMELLLGISGRYTPWAFFNPPDLFSVQRRSPFTFAQIAPLFGSAERRRQLRARAKSRKATKKSEQEEQDSILGALDEIDELNSMLGFIVGRIGQFLQG